MEAALTKLDLAKFPFTNEALGYIKYLDINPEDLVKPEFKPILERAVERVKEAILKSRIPSDLTQEEVDILAYPTSLLLVSLLADDRVRRRFALAEAKRAYELLRNEPAEKLLHIAGASFGWDAQLVRKDIGESHYELAVHFINYIHNSNKIRDLKWKLVNRVLSGGFVLLPREDFARLLQEEIQTRILERTGNSHPSTMQQLEPYLEQFRSIVKVRFRPEDAEDMPRTAVMSAIPPCMKSLLTLLQANKHISHMGRFAMAAFLLNIGIGEEELLKILQSFTDFDERIARYQIEHIAGRRGSRIKYTAPNCETMRTHGLCINPDELCANILHPLSYYRTKARRQFNKGAKVTAPAELSNKMRHTVTTPR